MTQHVTTPSDFSYNLPRSLIPLVGRAGELTQIRQQLLDPACRLLTLLGPGGMGKTRLALEVATSLQDEFAAGVYFVNLQPLSDPAQLPTALADALHFPLSGPESVVSQLIRYLANKEMLLLLDNFEHLLAGVDFLSELLLQSPGVKALITSREVLNLQEEWLFPLAGLAFPPVGFDPETMQEYAAASLFVDRMRRLRPHFVLAEEAAAIGRICQLVEGMPLALELAASWTKTLTCAEIATEIEQGIAFLTTSLRNTPERHRSMLAVFEWSWQQLSIEEQAVFVRLSVFRGGFRREAAAQVAGASLAQLSALVDKSLVRWDASGRYHLHELLRQFGEERLAQQPQGVSAAQERHAAYYVNFLHERLPDLLGKRQIAAINEIETELDNLRTAWLWCVAQNDQPALYRATPALAHFFQIRSRFQEGADLLAQAVQILTALRSDEEMTPEEGRTLALLLAQLGALYMRIVELEKMDNALRRSQQLFNKHQFVPARGFGTYPRLGLGIAAMYRGDLQRGLQEIQASLELNQLHNHPWNLVGDWYWLAIVQLSLQQVEAAQQSVQQALALAEQNGDIWFLAYIYDLLGGLAATQSEHSRAQHYYELGYARHQEVGDREGVAQALSYLGDLALTRGDFSAAQTYLGQSLALLQEFQQQSGMAEILIKLGKVTLRAGEIESSRKHLQRALHICLDQKNSHIALLALAWLAQLLSQMSAGEKTVEVCAFLQAKIATDIVSFRMSDHADINNTTVEQMLAEQKGKLSNALYKTAYRQGQQAELEQIAAMVLSSLVAPIQSTSENKPSAAPASPRQQANTALIEPLTERELEILDLIAEGQTNHAIADHLILSPGTVKWYSRSIFEHALCAAGGLAVGRWAMGGAGVGRPDRGDDFPVGAAQRERVQSRCCRPYTQRTGAGGGAVVASAGAMADDLPGDGGLGAVADRAGCFLALARTSSPSIRRVGGEKPLKTSWWWTTRRISRCRSNATAVYQPLAGHSIGKRWDNQLDQILYYAAVDLLKTRYPGEGGLATALYTEDGAILTSVHFQPEWGVGGLCAETGAILEAHKCNKRVTAILCVSRLTGDSPIVIATPCGLCQERLFHWGSGVEVAVLIPPMGHAGSPKP